MSIYGEGYYWNKSGEIREISARIPDKMKAGEWEITDESGIPLVPVPTNEKKNPSLASVYALSKYDQEQLCLILGKAYHIPTVALRFFNVYGTRQTLSNPYTGVLAIFASRLLNDRAPLIFEDGLQKRDFVSVKDIVQACVLAMESPEADDQIFNIGSGESYTVRDIAIQLAAVMGKENIQPQITGKYRSGDIRHCFAEITKAREILHYSPEISLQNGLSEYTQWLSYQSASDLVEKAQEELITRGLAI
jgi:dTDP-L-rhamnose 4-epimerase